MRNNTGQSEASLLYKTAYAAHYEAKDLAGALLLYKDVIATDPSSREAAYSRSQVQNIVKAVVPENELFAAQFDLAMAEFEPEPDRCEAGFSRAPTEDVR